MILNIKILNKMCSLQCGATAQKMVAKPLTVNAIRLLRTSLKSTRYAYRHTFLDTMNLIPRMALGFPYIIAPFPLLIVHQSVSFPF